MVSVLEMESTHARPVYEMNLAINHSIHSSGQLFGLAKRAWGMCGVPSGSARQASMPRSFAKFGSHHVTRISCLSRDSKIPFLALYPTVRQYILHCFMAYIPSHALAGLRNYKYKGVDRCDPLFILCERSLNISMKILILKLCIEPVLELVRHSLAGVDRAKHGTQPGS
jgi:hypothetical protein